jgi:hypothetical protein
VASPADLSIAGRFPTPGGAVGRRPSSRLKPNHSGHHETQCGSLNANQLAATEIVFKSNQQPSPRNLCEPSQGVQVRLMLPTLQAADRRRAGVHQLGKLVLGDLIFDPICDHEAGQSLQGPKGRCRCSVIGVRHSMASADTVVGPKRTRWRGLVIARGCGTNVERVLLVVCDRNISLLIRLSTSWCLVT